MIDEDYRTWLIEVNTNPYLGKPNSWMESFLPKMVDEMFQIVLDPFYPPRDEYYLESRTRKRTFELIYAEGAITNRDYLPHGNEAGFINQRRPFSHDLLYPLGVAPPADNTTELKALRQKYRVSMESTRSSSVNFKMGNYAMVENRRNSAAYQSMKRRKNYRPVSAVTNSAWGSPNVRK